MRFRKAVLFSMVVALPAVAMADLVHPLCQVERADAIPLSAGAMVDLMLGPLVHHGVSLVFLGSLAVVGLPWMIAGAAVLLAQFPRRFRSR
jgi:hypothetical protein